MFKKNLYSFCALLALSCSAYAMQVLNEDGSVASSSTSKRYALKASTASWGDDQEPTEASASSPASSTSSSFFPNDGEYVTFSTRPLMFAVEQGDPRAANLHVFLMKTYHSVIWNPDIVYALPLLQSQLDGNLCDLAQDQEFIRKIGKAIGVYPTTDEAINQLSEALGCSSQGSFASKEGRRKLKELTVEAAARLKVLELALEMERAKSQRLQEALNGIKEGIFPDLCQASNPSTAYSSIPHSLTSHPSE